jgi:hypothetical protein
MMKPAMEPLGLAAFVDRLQLSRHYLEYGCGGSTVLACQQPGIRSVISVDSDQAWTTKVRETTLTSHCRVSVEYCDIGPVEDWGKPIDQSGASTYWRYIADPWRRAAELGEPIDLVLIDGRFRVATFLFSLVASPPGAAILFDDYFNRPKYSVVERFCKPVAQYGRMAAFVVGTYPWGPEIVARIAQYSQISD